jgi:hypothetical protein
MVDRADSRAGNQVNTAASRITVRRDRPDRAAKVDNLVSRRKAGKARTRKTTRTSIANAARHSYQRLKRDEVPATRRDFFCPAKDGEERKSVRQKNVRTLFYERAEHLAYEFSLRPLLGVQHSEGVSAIRPDQQ